MKRKLQDSFLFILLLPTLPILLMGNKGCTQIDEFYVITSPVQHDFYLPGDIISLKKSSDGKTTTVESVVCRTSKHIEGFKIETRNSNTWNRTDIDKATVHIGGSLSTLEAVNKKIALQTGFKGNFIRTSELKISNGKIRAVLDNASMISALKRMNLVCAEAIIKARSQGQTVTVLYSTLQADISRVVTYDTSASAEVKLTAANILNTELKGGVSFSGSQIRIGADLIIGIRENMSILPSNSDLKKMYPTFQLQSDNKKIHEYRESKWVLLLKQKPKSALVGNFREVKKSIKLKK